MPRPGVAQPDTLPFFKFRLDEVVCLEQGVTDPVFGEPIIIPAGNQFSLRTELGFDGALSFVFGGQPYRVTHHWTRIEDGATGLLPLLPAGPPPAVPLAPPAITHFWNISDNYTTGIAGAVADLVMPTGFDSGTFRIMTHVHFQNQYWDEFAAAFHDGLVLMVID